MPKTTHRYGCRCPSCNSGHTRVDPKGRLVKVPIPDSSGTEIRTPQDAGMPTYNDPTIAQHKRTRKR